MTANIVNAGNPLAPGASAPLWTAQCDNSSNLVNTLAPPDLVIPIPGASGPGAINLPMSILSLDQIDSIVFTGTMKGKLGDTISLSLNHESYGDLPLIISHDIRGALSTAYPLPGETRTFLFGEVIPPGYIFKSYVGGSTSETITLPEGQSPTEYFYYYNGTGYAWQVKGRISGGPSHTITVPAHRYPYSPTYNYENAPGNLINLTSDIVFRGFRYRIIGGSGDPIVVRTQTFTHIALDTGDATAGTSQESTGVDPWNDFNGVYYLPYGYPGFQSTNPYSGFSERLWNDYGAHDFTIDRITQTVTSYSVSGSAYERIIQSYTVKFIKYQDITWSVQPLDQMIWESVIPASALYQYYPMDFGDYQDYAERSEALNVAALAWQGKASDGIWTIKYAGTSTVPVDASATVAEPLISPTVVPAIVRIDGLVLTIKFKTNPQYTNSSLAPVSSGGVTTTTTSANLRVGGDDRALIGILAGISSSSMGIFCGYSLQRIGRVGELYNVAYFVGITCNLNHVNMLRRKDVIEYLGKDWGDVPFSTKGDAGEGYVMGLTPWKIFPVRGQIGLKVEVKGATLTFRLLGTDYPPLTFIDPTVALITNYQRISLNA